MAKKSPKAHTKIDTSSQEKLFGEIQNSFSKQLKLEKASYPFYNLYGKPDQQVDDGAENEDKHSRPKGFPVYFLNNFFVIFYEAYNQPGVLYVGSVEYIYDVANP